MSNSYTSYWSNDRYKLMHKHGQAGKPLTVLFGGPHSSMPAFRRFGVSPGDYIYPVRVWQRDLYILGRMRVERLLTITEYADLHREIFGLRTSPSYDDRFAQWRREHPEVAHLAPTCTEEAAIGDIRTNIGLDILVPGEMLSTLRYRSQKAERPLKYVSDGKINSTISIAGGTYRLSDESAQVFDMLISRG